MGETEKQGSEAAGVLDELRAERHALEARRRERDEASAMSERVASERLALANLQAIEKAETEHGPVGKRIQTVDTDLGVVIVKRAHPATWKRFQDRGESKVEDLEKLVRPCLVHPDLTTFERMVDEQPAILTRVANAIAALAGFRVEEVRSKS